MNELIKKSLEEYNVLTVMIVAIIIGGTLYLIKKTIQVLISKDLVILQDELKKHSEQLEHIHQVSQVTYQNLFQKKINVYQNLIEIKSKYPIQKQNIPEEYYEDFLRDYEKTLKSIINIVETNSLFISQELLTIYQKLNQKYSKFDNKYFELSKKNAMADNNDDYIECEIEEIKLYEKVYNEIKIEFKDFIEVLDNDISKIKAKINFD